MPKYSPKTGFMNTGKPVIASYFNSSWTCTCKHKSTFGTFKGKHCWHEEWAIKDVVKTLQETIREHESKTSSDNVPHDSMSNASRDANDDEDDDGAEYLEDNGDENTNDNDDDDGAEYLEVSILLTCENY